eukprot:2880698-Amphidinium_carterae.1
MEHESCMSLERNPPGWGLDWVFTPRADDRQPRHDRSQDQSAQKFLSTSRDRTCGHSVELSAFASH